MKKTMSKITIMAVAALTTITSMISISASANDGMTKEQADAAAAAANAAAEAYVEPADGYDIITDGYFTNPVDSVETTTEAPETTEVPDYSNIFAQGNWYSVGMSGVKDYWFSASRAQGSCTDEGTGNISYFSYDFAGNRVVFYYDNNTTLSGTVSYEGYDMVIAWDNGFSERLSTTHPSVNIEPEVTTITTENRYNKPMLAHGTWYVTNTAGSKKYCFDIIEPIGCMYDFDGSAREFEYTIDGADLEFHIIGAARGSHAVVNYNADGTFSLSWADGTFEVLSQTEPTAVTTPAATTAPAVNTTVKATEVKKTTNTTAASQAVTTTTATQAVKKAPASTDSPKTGDKFPVIALTIAAIAAGTAGIVSSKKFSKK
ncbi:MAG: hypothetical protein IKS03_00560 [Ruminococcus sp.]|nr:hypothetical protein [Ruminococcus sp.]